LEHTKLYTGYIFVTKDWLKLTLFFYHQNKNENNEIALADIFLDFNFTHYFLANESLKKLLEHTI